MQDKDGIPAITTCVSLSESRKEKAKGDGVNTDTIPDPSVLASDQKTSDAKIMLKIQRLAVGLVWKLSSYGPTIMQTLKLNDAFIDQVLKLSNGPANKSKKIAESIIWRLGSEKIVRLELTQKEQERERNRRDTRGDATDDERLSIIDQWDDSIPYDLLMVYSNNVNDKIVSLKIADRLRKKNYRIFSEKQGKHRLELMRIAAAKQKPFLACLSSKFRESKFCMEEVDNASKLKCPIIPVVVEENYTVKGWLNHVIGDHELLDFTGENFIGSLVNLISELDELKKTEEKS